MLLAMSNPGHTGNVLRQPPCSRDADESPTPNLRCGVRVADLQLGRTLNLLRTLTVGEGICSAFLKSGDQDCQKLYMPM
jgi:hypothetical protein